MKEIELTQGYKAIVDDDKYEFLNRQKWWADVKKYGKVYAASEVNGKKIKMHQMLLPCPKGFIPDHKDGNGLNNQMRNLRIATQTQNAANRTIRNKAGYKGVHFTGKSW